MLLILVIIIMIIIMLIIVIVITPRGSSDWRDGHLHGRPLVRPSGASLGEPLRGSPAACGPAAGGPVRRWPGRCRPGRWLPVGFAARPVHCRPGPGRPLRWRRPLQGPSWSAARRAHSRSSEGGPGGGATRWTAAAACVGRGRGRGRGRPLRTGGVAGGRAEAEAGRRPGRHHVGGAAAGPRLLGLGRQGHLGLRRRWD